MQNNSSEFEINQIEQKINTQLAQVDQKILDTAQSYPPIIAQFINEIVQSSGKHLRSKICLAFSHAYQIPSPMAISLSAGLEILHLATLIHDDLIDQADLRRGVIPIHKRIGPKSTILFGDVLFGIAAQYVASTNNTQMSNAFAHTVETIARAELLNSLSKTNAFDQTQAIQLAYTKTGILFELAAKIALYHTQDQNIIAKATIFGKEFGIAYQLIDDLVDIGVSSQTTQKTGSKDLANQTITLPYILYFNTLTPTQQQEFQTQLQQKHYQTIQTQVLNSSAIEETKQQIATRIKKAKEEILPLPAQSQQYLLKIIEDTLNLIS